LGSRTARLRELKALSKNKEISVPERKKWRAQLYSLKRRLDERLDREARSKVAENFVRSNIDLHQLSPRGSVSSLEN
jgi:hypothetical protein